MLSSSTALMLRYFIHPCTDGINCEPHWLRVRQKNGGNNNDDNKNNNTILEYRPNGKY